MQEAFERIKVPLFGIFGIVAITMVAFAVIKPQVFERSEPAFTITGNVVADDALFEGKIAASGPCSMIEEPVCGADGRTYRNLCHARSAGTDMRHAGACDSERVGEDS